MAVVIPEKLISMLRVSGKTDIYKPKTKIFSQGESASGFYIISSGRVRVYTITDAGYERTIEILEVGRIFGDSSFLSNAYRFVNIEAVIACEIISFTADELITLCTKSEELMKLIFQHMADTCNYLTKQLIQTTSYDSTQKIAAFLLNESENRRQTVLPYSHEEVAASVGLNRVTVSRVISNLKKQQIIRVGYRTIEICDALHLKSLLLKNDTRAK